MEKKKVLYNVTHPYFESKGFKFYRKIPDEYRKYDEGLIICFNFMFFSNSDNHFHDPIQIHHEAIEKIILEVGIPTNTMEGYRTGENYFYTVQDIFPEGYRNKIESLNLKTEEGFEKWGNLIIEYLENEGKIFLETYSYLPNILREMDRLEEEGMYWTRILTGEIDNIFRGLLISKLCNDSDFERKLKKWEAPIMNSKHKLWHPHFKKLKAILDETKPVYNL